MQTMYAVVNRVVSVVLGLVLGVLPSASQPSSTLQTVVIDAGHGGKDPGAKGKLTNEKSVTLSIALKLGAYIRESFPEISVIFTRETDEFIPLDQRASIANRHHADVFISIHCNSLARRANATKGTETYVMGLDRTAHNLEVAKRENSVIMLEDNYLEKYDGFDPNSPESHIVLSIFQDASLAQSVFLATQIEEEFRSRTQRSSRGVKRAGFVVLRETTMPSVLIETGFLSSDDEEAFLTSESGQEAMAQGIFRAFTTYKEMLEGKTPEPQAVAPPSSAAIATELAAAAPPTDDLNDYYCVQLAASSSPLAPAHPLRKAFPALRSVPMGSHYKHLTGSFLTYEEATAELAKLKAQGYRDAFVVLLQSGKHITPFKQQQ